jgi:hypothetical protein
MVDVALRKPAASERAISWLRRLRGARRWIPKSLLLALLGIGLSSWLIPAITRQWDDRQKTGDLKAALVADMATVTGRAVLDAQALSQAPEGNRPSPAEIDASVKEWSVGKLGIRARLDAYFGRGAVDAWAVLATYVDSTLSRAYRHDDQDAVIPGRWEDVAIPAGPLQDAYSKYYSGHAVINDLATELLAQEDRVARSILAMKVRGYSTTWHDLLSDLVPLV